MSNNPPYSPTPVPVPTPTRFNLPDIPHNAYTLLTELADAIDTAKTKLSGHAQKLNDIHTESNNAVNEVTTHSKGQATDTLTLLWGGSQTDLTNAHDNLTAITSAKEGIGPGPNDFRSTLEANKSAIQTGLIALTALQQQEGLSTPTVSPQQLEEWKQDINALNASIANINITLDAITMTMTTLNNGFSNVCATGLTPGSPPPLFHKNAFANQTHDSGSSSGDGGGNTPDTTPEGRPISSHASGDSLGRHKMTPSQVDDVIDNYSRKSTQTDGATVFIKKQAGRGQNYSIVIMGKGDTIVTAMRDLSPSELRHLAQNYGFDPNP